MIRIATLDSHPTVLAGVEAILRDRFGLAHVGSAHDRYGLWPLLQRTHPDLVLLEHGPDADGLELCLRLKDRPSAPRVVLHGGGDAALVPAAFAGADALIDRSAPVRELVETLREPRLPELSARQRARAAERLDHADRPSSPCVSPAGRLRRWMRLPSRRRSRSLPARVRGAPASSKALAARSSAFPARSGSPAVVSARPASVMPAIRAVACALSSPGGDKCDLLDHAVDQGALCSAAECREAWSATHLVDPERFP